MNELKWILRVLAIIAIPIIAACNSANELSEPIDLGMLLPADEAALVYLV